MNYFTFDGIDSRTYNTYIATSNAFDAPGREDEVIKVPGSNNIYYLTEGTYKPFDIKLYCYIPSNMQVKTDDLRNFLLSKGTCRYTEAIRPNEFRVARFIEAYEIEVSDRVSAAFVLTFKAQPQRYLISNDPITTTATADTTTDTTMSLSTVPTPINISLNGNTTQEGSSGKNLTGTNELYHGYYNTTDIELLVPNEAYRTVIINNLTARTYTLSFSTSFYILRYAVGSENHNISETKQTFTFTTSTTGTFKLCFRKADSSTITDDFTTQLERGSTATSYEPHISPTNPQPIHNVSGDNEVSVTGFNLWDEQWELGYYGSNGVKWNSPNCIRSVNAINVLPNTAYYLCYTNSWGVSICLRFYDKYNNFISNGGQPSYPKGIITTPNNASYMRFYMADAYGTTYKHDICINVSDTQKNGTYEPYTRQSYPFYLPVENLFDYSTATNTGVVDDSGTISTFNTRLFSAKISVFPNTTYTFKTSAYSQNNERIYINRLIFYGQNGSFLRRNATYNTYSEATFTTPSDTYYLVIDLRTQYLTTSLSKDLLNGNTQLEKGSHANHYTPYGTTPIELNKIGDYQDYLYKSGGKWYVYKAIKKVTLDGTEYWASDSRGFYLEINDMRRTYNYIGNMLCDKLTVYTGASEADFTSQIYGITAWNASSYPNQNWIYARANNETTPSGFKTWLSSNHLLVYYQLKTPTNTEITDTTLINQLNNIEKAYSYNGTTNILQVSNDNGFMLEVVSLHSNDVNSDYKGEPIITVNSTGLIYFNGCVIKVNQAPMTINSQTMQAYNGAVNLNNYIEANDFPMIEAGTNVIGSEMPLSIVPNYWKL